MRKKVLSVLLCATLVAGIAVGCGSKSSSEKSSADAKKSDKKVITVGFDWHDIGRPMGGLFAKGFRDIDCKRYDSVCLVLHWGQTP